MEGECQLCGGTVHADSKDLLHLVSSSFLGTGFAILKRAITHDGRVSYSKTTREIIVDTRGEEDDFTFDVDAIMVSRLPDRDETCPPGEEDDAVLSPEGPYHKGCWQN